MSSNAYDEILKRAQELPADEQQKLIRELARGPSSETNGDETTLGECMESRGLLGIARGPADLSTNPKYMQGFGEHGH